MITHLFFDAGNTLVFPNFDLISEKLADLGARVDPAVLERAEQETRFQLDDPELVRSSNDSSRWTLYFKTIFLRSGLSDRSLIEAVLVVLRKIHQTSNLWEIVPPDVPEALKGLQGRYRMSVISNANGTVRDKLRRVGLLDFFETVIDSAEEGIEKPDPRIFHAAVLRTGARMEQSLYIGDMYHIDVAGARAAGMDVVLLDPAGLHQDKPVRRIAGLGALVSSIDPR